MTAPQGGAPFDWSEVRIIEADGVEFVRRDILDVAKDSLIAVTASADWSDARHAANTGLSKVAGALFVEKP